MQTEKKRRMGQRCVLFNIFVTYFYLVHHSVNIYELASFRRDKVSRRDEISRRDGISLVRNMSAQRSSDNDRSSLDCIQRRTNFTLQYTQSKDR